MDIKFKTFSVIFGLLILTWAGAYFLYENTKLDKPIFLKHYYDLSVGEDGDYFQLFYVKDQYDDRKVISIHFPDEPDMMMSIEEGHQTNVGKHRIVELYINLFQPVFKEEVFHTNKLTVSYSDGSQETVEIGDIYISKYPTNDNEVLQFIASGSGGDQDFSTVQASKDFTLKKLSHPFEDILREHLKVELDFDQETLEKMDQRKKENQNRDPSPDKSFIVNKAINLPIDIHKGEYLKIVSYFEHMKNEGYYLSFPLTAEIEQDGKTSEIMTSHIRYHPHWERSSLKSYLKEMRYTK